MLVDERPGEEDEERPEVEELGRVDLRHMVGLVTENDASVDEDEDGERHYKTDEGLKD